MESMPGAIKVCVAYVAALLQGTRAFETSGNSPANRCRAIIKKITPQSTKVGSALI